MWESRGLITLWTFTACYRNSFTEVIMKSTGFWDVILCSPVNTHWLLKKNISYPFLGSRISQARNQKGACRLIPLVSCLVTLRPWIWRRYVIRNIGHSPNYSVLQSTRPYFSIQVMFFLLIYWNAPKVKTKLRGFSAQANYTDLATAACRRS
jgi:hypothetical protein